MSSALSLIPLAFMSDSNALINDGMSMPSSAQEKTEMNTLKKATLKILIIIFFAKNRSYHSKEKDNNSQIPKFAF